MSRHCSPCYLAFSITLINAQPLSGRVPAYLLIVVDDTLAAHSLNASAWCMGTVLAAFRVRHTVRAALEGAAVGVQYLGGGFHGHRQSDRI